MAKVKLSPESLWLLCHLNEKAIEGVSIINPLPVPPHMSLPKMRHIKGLEKRGWAEEEHRGIYYITDDGKRAITKMLVSYRVNEIWRQKRNQPPGTVHG